MRLRTGNFEGALFPAERKDETDLHWISDRGRRHAPGEKLMNRDQLKKYWKPVGAVTDPPGADDPAP